MGVWGSTYLLAALLLTDTAYPLRVKKTFFKKLSSHKKSTQGKNRV